MGGNLDRSPTRGATRAAVLLGLTCAAGLAAGPRRVAAQMPGQPVLQNAFSNPGVTLAANFGAAEAQQAFAGAVAWAPGGNRFQLSGGVGVWRVDAETKINSAATYGARVMVPVLSFGEGGRVGVAAFGGVGAGRLEGVTRLQVPVGASVGFRTRLGESRGLSVYAAPFFGWTRESGGSDGQDTSRSSGLFRVSFGLDVAVFRSVGVTVGYETGAEAKDADPGPRGGLFGAGVSYAF